jgi:bifunctional DNase/RNase
MSLKEQLSTDAQTMINLDELAIKAVYHKADGSELQLSCLIDSLSANNTLKGNKEVEDELMAYVAIDFIPNIYEKFTVDNITYTIKQYSVDDMFTTLVLSNEKRPTGKNYGFRS